MHAGVNRISTLILLPAARKIAPISQWEHVILSRGRVLHRRKLRLNRFSGSTRYKYIPRNEEGGKFIARAGECVLSRPDVDV